ncbi:hypothetical protein C7H19_24535 [Aphanothece hegewaldii CCALA 016]|uniref:Uncharacterized protein n=1 Tax=Aphanothece hegewaldii CCALA 016 TaxID=2107694 RepID=A0A2T1LQQ0_9CHRO|nr:hypothetical protein [Aphanothece hegewaldii]PSF28945.1 hypothetical protein C7H19_24535 [Aphanothece hegewaldii CCALA 016]
MIINTDLLVNNLEIIQGLLSGKMVRYGSVIRWAKGTPKAGQIIKHLAESPGITSKLISLPVAPISTGVDIIGHGLTYHKLLGLDSQLIGVSHQLLGIEKTLGSVLGLTQIAAGASVLNLGVSIAGFAYMGYKLHRIQQSLGHLQHTMETGFNRVEVGLRHLDDKLTEGFTVILKDLNHLDNRLAHISGQLTYLYLLVQNSRKKQESLAKAISHLHQATLIKEIASLQAELDDRSRFSDESPREALKTASRARLFLGSEAMKVTPELDAELMLNSDVSIQGWAVAIATEANLLLKIGKHQEAKQLLANEIPKFQQIAERWTDKFINDDNYYLATVYRYDTPLFKEYITLERVDRISQISTRDRTLNSEQIREKKNLASVEFEMSYSQEKYNQAWVAQKIALAEYLDTLSELVARLDSLQHFAHLCQIKDVKSSTQLLPDSNTEPGLYLL